MKPSWSIFDCRQLISFRLPLTEITGTMGHSVLQTDTGQQLLGALARRATVRPRSMGRELRCLTDDDGGRANSHH